MEKIKKQNLVSFLLFMLVILICVISAQDYLRIRKPLPYVPGPGLSEIRMLSEYFPGLKGTPGDTEIFVLQGEKKGGKALVLGGTHAIEIGAQMAAVVLLENAKVAEGTLYIIPRTNASAFTHNDSQEGHPDTVLFTTDTGQERPFRYGSRATNPIHQWPDPDVYINYMGQQLSGSETRNLNRCYPGNPDGTLTEKICYGIVELIKKEQIDVTVDLHEASPEYPVINAIVAHEKSMGLASAVAVEMHLSGIPINLEPSPKNFRGLSHRELGDHTDTLPLLMESPNPSQGRMRGKTDDTLIKAGISDLYVKAGKVGMLYIPYDDSGWPLETRAGRHIEGLKYIFSLYSQMYGKPLVVENLPSLMDLEEHGLGHYLNDLS
jgi:hypothetical protein